MAVSDDRSDVKQTTAGFRGPLMVQSLTSAKSKFLSLSFDVHPYFGGTLFEKFYSQNKLEEYFAYLKDYRINMLEISTGTVDIPVEERVSIVD